jgi:hypothetical protein
MATLPSGLPDVVADAEDLTRFITQSNHFNKTMAKPAAFLPNPKCRNTSVYRCGPDVEIIRRIWQKNNLSGRPLKAAATCKTANVRAAELDVIAKEPPDAHANIENWPWLDNDPELQKAKQLEKAQSIAQKSKLVAVTFP